MAKPKRHLYGATVRPHRATDAGAALMRSMAVQFLPRCPGTQDEGGVQAPCRECNRTYVIGR